MGESDKYRIVIEEHPEYLFVCLEAQELSHETIAEYQNKIVREVQRRPYRRVMIKRDVHRSDTFAELYRIPLMIDGLNARGIRYAIVDADPQYTSTYKLAMLHLKTRGFDIEVFGDVQSAEKWLLKSRNGHSRFRRS